jgi:hypothetical protein
MTGQPGRRGPAGPGPAARSFGPENPAPHNRAPQDAAPDDLAPQDLAPQDQAQQAPAQQPSSVRRLCAIVLIMETVVIWLSIPVALAVDHASPSRIGVAGVVLAIAAVVLAALARRRPRWTIIGGSVLQALVIAAGTIVPVMYFLGAIFAALWVIGIGLGRRLDALP